MLKARSAAAFTVTDTMRVTQSVGLRFMLVYVRYIQPLRALAEGWSKLSLLIRAALPGNEVISASVLLLMLKEWERRVSSLGQRCLGVCDNELCRTSDVQHAGMCATSCRRVRPRARHAFGSSAMSLREPPASCY